MDWNKDRTGYGGAKGIGVGTELILGKQRGIDLGETKGNLGRDRIG